MNRPPAKWFLFALVASLCVLQVGAFDASSVVSPAAGLWRNKQALVLKSETGVDFYYSLTGADPLVSGFFYDGPVLINETGKVRLRIVAVSSDGSKKELSLEYVVDETSGGDFDDHPFVRHIKQNPILSYESGSSFRVPDGLLYCLDNRRSPYIEGGILFLSARNNVERFIPCTIASADGGGEVHFVIHVTAKKRELPPKLQLPFEVSEWTHVSLSDTSFIYSVDGDMWAAGEDCDLDRSVPHTISWQSIEYSSDNAVFEYTLPPKPTLFQYTNPDGSVCFFIEEVPGGRKRDLSEFLIDERGGSDTKSLHYTFSGGSRMVFANAFAHEDLKERVQLALYCDGNLQGTIEQDVHIDRLPPVPPQITSSDANPTAVEITAEEGSSVFYALSVPVEAPLESPGYYHRGIVPGETGEFKLYEGGMIDLEGGNGCALLYQISAFAVDSSGNKSDTSELELVVDKANYYLAAKSNGGKQDGSFENPFTSLEQFLALLNISDKKLNLHVFGSVDLPRREILIEKPCRFIGHDDAHFAFAENSLFRLRHAEVVFEDFVFEKHSAGQMERGNLFELEDSELVIEHCELSGVFTEGGSLITSNGSTVQLVDTGLTATAGTWACGLQAVDSTVTATLTRWTSSAAACVNASVTGGSSSFEECSFSLIGKLGRGIELQGAASSVADSEFTARLDPDTKNSFAIWSDDKDIVTSERNVQRGF